MSDDKDLDKMQMKSVYQSLDSVLSVFKGDTLAALPEVQELLHIYHDVFSRDTSASAHIEKRKPFVVFEGLDGCGKSTISRQVAKSLKGVVKRTPPKCVSHLRSYFDKYPSYVRRAFYSLGNYIAAQNIQELRQKKPVLLDRFWFSTAAYALAQELQDLKISALPPPGDCIYVWPDDLLKPDLVIFLDVDEEVRYLRHARRKQTTEEEDQLARNQAFRSCVLAAYEHMTDPPLIHVDSNESVEETVEKCLGHIRLLTTVQ